MLENISNSLINNFSVSDAIAVLSAIVAVGSAIVSVIKSISAKKDRKAANEYARNANEANIAATLYYEAMLHDLGEKKIESEQKDSKSDLKNSVYKIILEQDPISTESIANKLGISIDELKPLLREMFTRDKSIKFITIDGVDMNSDMCHWRIA